MRPGWLVALFLALLALAPLALPEFWITLANYIGLYAMVALGLVHPDRVKKNSAAQVGDVLVLGKPLGVGVYSAALKKGELNAEGYAQMIASTTRLNTAGPDLAQLPGVHAITDVTGFALAGHALELARGAGVTVQLDWSSVPLLPGVRDLAAQGIVTGASGRNWAAYGAEVALPEGFADAERALLTDPQTSGGLLVACAPESLRAVLDVFKAQGFGDAAVVGRVLPKGEKPLVVMALEHKATFWTQDVDYADLPGVRYFAKTGAT